MPLSVTQNGACIFGFDRFQTPGATPTVWEHISYHRQWLSSYLSHIYDISPQICDNAKMQTAIIFCFVKGKTRRGVYGWTRLTSAKSRYTPGCNRLSFGSIFFHIRTGIRC